MAAILSWPQCVKSNATFLTALGFPFALSLTRYLHALAELTSQRVSIAGGVWHRICKNIFPPREKTFVSMSFASITVTVNVTVLCFPYGVFLVDNLTYGHVSVTFKWGTDLWRNTWRRPIKESCVAGYALRLPVNFYRVLKVLLMNILGPVY